MKPHLKPTLAQLKLNAAMKRLPFYTQGAGHLTNTKHSKAYSDYGYPLALDFWFFYTMYKRIGLARAGVERPVDMCWLTPPLVKEETIKQDGQVEAVEYEPHAQIAERLELWAHLKQLDYMQRVGHYAGLFIRVRDGRRPEQPLDSVSVDDILEVVPCWEAQLIPGTLDNDPQSPRYGLPINYTYYQRGTREFAQRDGGESMTIHWTRLLIWNEGAAGNTIYGESAIEPAYNALMDWEKIRGAGGEGFWRQAALRGVLQASKETAGQAPTDEEMESLIDAISDMQESFDSVPYLGGMELNTLQTNLANPEHFKNTALEDVAAGFKWSAKGLIGAQEGRMAGEQDSSLDKQTAQSRRESFLSRMIRRWLMWLEVHTDFDGANLKVEFDDLMAPSDEKRLENAAKMADINYKQWQATGSTVYTPNELREITMFEAQDELDELPFEDGVTDVDDVSGA